MIQICQVIVITVTLIIITNSQYSQLVTVNASSLKNIESQMTSLMRFQETIQQFYYIKRNIKATKIAQLIEKGGCKTQNQFGRFAVVNNTFYSYGSEKQTQKTKNFKRYLNKLITKANISDLYMIINFQDVLNSQKIGNNTYYQCRSLPLFMLRKNDTNQLQKTKFLLPSNQNMTSDEIIEGQTIQILNKYAQYQQINLTQQQKMTVKNKIDINIILNDRRKKQQNQVELMQENKRKQSMKLITFDQTIQAFPFLKQNINQLKIFKLLQAEACAYSGNTQVIFLLLNNKLFRYGRYKTHYRTKFMMDFFARVLKMKKLPDMLFLFRIQDQLHPLIVPQKNHEICRQLPVFISNKNHSNILEQTKFLFPDPFIHDKWPETIMKIKQQSLKIQWKDKSDQAFFIGLASGAYFYDYPNVSANSNIFKYFQRGGLVLLSNERPDLINARLTYTKNNQLLQYLYKKVGKQNVIKDRVPFETSIKYKYLLTTDGFGAPWKRTPSILFSNSLLLKPFSQKIQWFYDKMLPNVHYIPINEDLSDLTSKIQYLNQNDSKIKDMISQSNKLAQQYLTPTAIEKFAVQTLQKYASIQKLNLSLQAKQRIRRGMDILQVLRIQYNKLQRQKLKINLSSNSSLIKNQTNNIKVNISKNQLKKQQEQKQNRQLQNHTNSSKPIKEQIKHTAKNNQQSLNDTKNTQKLLKNTQKRVSDNNFQIVQDNKFVQENLNSVKQKYRLYEQIFIGSILMSTLLVIIFLICKLCGLKIKREQQFKNISQIKQSQSINKQTTGLTQMSPKSNNFYEQ